MDGIWTIEVYGEFGWQNAGVVMVDGPQVVAGNNDYYATGLNTGEGDQVRVDLTLIYYGSPRTLFAETRSHVKAKLVGERDGAVVNGTMQRPDRPGFTLHLRLTRRANLPALDANA